MTIAQTIGLGWDRTRLELLMYSREKETVFFSFLFPILLLSLFSVIFAPQFDRPEMVAAGVNAGRFFLPGMVSAGVMLTSFQTMAISVTSERDDGTLKRLRVTPMPPVAYFLGKVGLVAITSLVQLVVLLLVARFGFQVTMPQDLGQYDTLAWVFALGVVCGTALGIAYSSFGTSRSIGAVVIGPVLVLQFISGVYLDFSDLPQWMQQVAAAFPLKWIAQGMRSVFLPDGWASQEMAGSWELGRVALVLVAWSVVGFAACLRTFSWFKRGTV
jgi:ABC-2 type transport system permease protein